MLVPVHWSGDTGRFTNPERWFLLSRLSDEHGRYMGELADPVLIYQPALTGTIDRMASGNLVHRRADTKDSRRVRVDITDHGLALVARLKQRVDQRHDAVGSG